MAAGGGQQAKMFETGAALIGYDDPKKLSREFGEDAFGTLVKTLEKIKGIERREDQVTATRGLFGQAAVDEIWVLLNNLDAVPGLLEEIASGAYRGSVAEEYGYLEDTYAFKKAQFEQVWGNFLIEAGQPFMEGLKETWDKHGDKLVEKIPVVADKFAAIADNAFADGGLVDRAIDLLPKAIDVFAWFIETVGVAVGKISYIIDHPIKALGEFALGETKLLTKFANTPGGTLIAGGIELIQGASKTSGNENLLTAGHPEWTNGSTKAAPQAPTVAPDYERSRAAISGFAVGGISTYPQLAAVSELEPEIHLTRRNVREFLDFDTFFASVDRFLAMPAQGAAQRGGGDTFQFIYNGTAATKEEAEAFGRFSFEEFQRMREQDDFERGRLLFA